MTSKLSALFYFARPYHSWERGSNENLNGILRQYIPKDKEFKYITGERLKEITYEINIRPRKRLGFMSPKEAIAFKNMKQFKKYMEKFK